jgi:phage protein D
MDYKIIVDGADVTDKITVVDDVLYANDRAGAMADDTKLLVDNASAFQLEKGQSVTVSFNGYTTGEMVIDKVEAGTRNASVGAISTTAGAKKKRSRHYRKVRFFDIINDVATDTGFGVFYQGGVENRLYESVTRFCETPLAFLNRLCIREGYGLKIDDRRIIIYCKEFAEAALPVMTITQADSIGGRVAFRDAANTTQSVTVRYFDLLQNRNIEYTAEIPDDGEQITVVEYVQDAAEAERFAKNYLLDRNKSSTIATALIPINTDIAATSVITFDGFGRYDGKYFVEELAHCPLTEQTKITARKIKGV